MAKNDDRVIRHARELLGDKRPGARLPASEYAELLASYRRLLARFNKVMTISDAYDAELKKVTEQLEQLRSLALPICMFCKKVRVDDDYWEQIDGYFARHIDVAFTHGICPTCMTERYGDLLGEAEKKGKLAIDVRSRPGAASRRIPEEDETVRAAERLLETPDAGLGTVRTGLRKLTDRYRRLLRRMGKILLISDGYQARLMELNTSLNLLAHTDGLTGLGNRHDAVEKLEAEKSRTERHGGAFTVAIVDVDDFKAVNDTRGHEAGDLLLRELGRVLRAATRREDTCARWGGEEFLLVLPETDAPAAAALLGKLLNATRALSVPYRGQPLRCTISAGHATFHGN
ncbi:MAG TPA: diguanylate cyclase, partial [Spirochaetia bacterium]